MSKNHGMEMFQLNDQAHLDAMNKMKGLMQNPEDMQQWMESKRQMFDALPDD